MQLCLDLGPRSRHWVAIDDHRHAFIILYFLLSIVIMMTDYLIPIDGLTTVGLNFLRRITTLDATSNLDISKQLQQCKQRTIYLQMVMIDALNNQALLFRPNVYLIL